MATIQFHTHGAPGNQAEERGAWAGQSEREITVEGACGVVNSSTLNLDWVDPSEKAVPHHILQDSRKAGGPS
ncbi:hypothetical protein P7K49_014263, partial [Saguinus oedipus]